MRNAVGTPFGGAGFEDYGADPSEIYFIACCVVGMGDHNSVDVVQTMHIDMLHMVVLCMRVGR